MVGRLSNSRATIESQSDPELLTRLQAASGDHAHGFDLAEHLERIAAEVSRVRARQAAGSPR